ncbi:MAG: ATP-binding protein [Bacteroidetes bacterium CG12_big_fil_rev_8_21_14_0_65_60_17]|nr:MAG: ATP-binding protein [Bacteroidetes bacterium CG12_big_fil_rev_8_21_14_0_65_60_17]
MRHFRIQITLRILLTAATITGGVALYLWGGSVLAALLLTGVVAAQTASLIRYTDRTNRDVARFLMSIRYSDFSQAFSASGRGSSFAELAGALNSVMDDFRAARSNTEEHYRYLQTVMQHVGTGLITYTARGDVELINTAAKRLLRVGYLKHISGLSEFSPELVRTLESMGTGGKRIVKVILGDDLLELVVYGTTFRMKEETYTLVSIQDIQTELEEKEIEAWQKLTRVLTHEIMNSITPISSLAETVHGLVEDEMDRTGHDLRGDTRLGDIRDAVETIERRSHSLIRFVQAYRSLTRIPRPDLTIFQVADLLADMERLFRAELTGRNIRLDVTCEPASLDLTADREQVEQILINLIRNSVQSLSDAGGGTIVVRARLGERGRPVLQVVDDGPGIEPEALDKIFIPFFTTRKDGSGIGMSLARQIMRQHGGVIGVVSKPGARTIVTLRF